MFIPLGYVATKHSGVVTSEPFFPFPLALDLLEASSKCEKQSHACPAQSQTKSASSSSTMAFVSCIIEVYWDAYSGPVMKKRSAQNNRTDIPRKQSLLPNQPGATRTPDPCQCPSYPRVVGLWTRVTCRPPLQIQPCGRKDIETGALDKNTRKTTSQNNNPPKL